MTTPTIRELLDDATIITGTGVWDLLRIITSPWTEDEMACALHHMSHVQFGAFMMAMGYRRIYDAQHRYGIAEHLYGDEYTRTDYAKVLRALAFAMEQTEAAEDFADRRNSHGDSDEQYGYADNYREDFHADG